MMDKIDCKQQQDYILKKGATQNGSKQNTDT